MKKQHIVSLLNAYPGETITFRQLRSLVASLQGTEQVKQPTLIIEPAYPEVTIQIPNNIEEFEKAVPITGCDIEMLKNMDHTFSFKEFETMCRFEKLTDQQTEWLLRKLKINGLICLTKENLYFKTNG